MPVTRSSSRRKAASSSHHDEGVTNGDETQSSMAKKSKTGAEKRRAAVRPKKRSTPSIYADALNPDLDESSGATNDESDVGEKRKNGDIDADSVKSVSSGSDSGNDESTKENSTNTNKKRRSTKQTPDSESGEEKDIKGSKSKKVEHQRVTERDEIPKLWDSEEALKKYGSYTFTIMSWNVAGLRALMKNHPTALSDLAEKHSLDVISLQETKLQQIHIDDPKLKIGDLLKNEGYDSYYNCATSKKGYSGTAVFVKRRKANTTKLSHASGKKQATLGSFFKAKSGKAMNDTVTNKESSDALGDVDVSNLIPTKVSYGLGKSKHDDEGRAITLDFPLFTMTALYVPNSGQNLDRLGYRTEEWDSDLLSYMERKGRERNVPVIWLGDLNVAHTSMEVWNDGAKHLAKSAGTTPEERDSFRRQLLGLKGNEEEKRGGGGKNQYIDAFRELHPNAKGHYTYWSQRAGNRGPNKGLRLDYFVCSRELLPSSQLSPSSSGGAEGDGAATDCKVMIRDCYMIPEQMGSDHCPIVLELEIKK